MDPDPYIITGYVKLPTYSESFQLGLLKPVETRVAKSIAKGAITSFVDTSICSGQVAQKYLTGAAIAASPIVFGLGKMEAYGRGSRLITRGFILARPNEDGGIYLDVVCSLDGKGGQLIKRFMEYCTKVLHAPYVELNSLPHVLSYYPSLGYHHRTSCQTPPEIEMSPELIAEFKSSGVRTTDAALRNPAGLDFMMNLHRLGFTKNKEGVCANLGISSEDFVTNECYNDGFTMRYCNPTGGSRRKTYRKKRGSRKSRIMKSRVSIR
jgi:hypothetical protein